MAGNGLSDNDTTERRKKKTSAIQWKHWLMSSVDTDSHKPHTIKYSEYWILNTVNQEGSSTSKCLVS